MLGLIMGFVALLFVRMISPIEGLMEGKSYAMRGVIGGTSVGLLATATFLLTGTLYPFGLSYELIRISFSGDSATFSSRWLT